MHEAFALGSERSCRARTSRPPQVPSSELQLPTPDIIRSASALANLVQYNIQLHSQKTPKH